MMTARLLLAVLNLAGWRGETVNFRPAAFLCVKDYLVRLLFLG